MYLVFFKSSFIEHEEFEVFDCYEMDLLHVCMGGHKGDVALFKHNANIVITDVAMDIGRKDSEGGILAIIFQRGN